MIAMVSNREARFVDGVIVHAFHGSRYAIGLLWRWAGDMTCVIVAIHLLPQDTCRVSRSGR